MIRLSQVGASAAAFLFLRNEIPNPISMTETKTGNAIPTTGTKSIDPGWPHWTRPHHVASLVSRLVGFA